jgi:hypothetical protein
METKREKREAWLTSSRKAVDILRELQQTDIGNPQIPADMRREMDAFMRRVENEETPAGAPSHGRI